MDKKYVCYAGTVFSQSDSDEHFISAHRIPELYGVNPEECVFVDPNRPETYRGKDLKMLIGLYPRSSGIYDLPK